MSQASRALAYAFEAGALAEKRAFFLRAEDLPLKDIVAEQSFRPEFLRLQHKGWEVVARLSTGGFALGLMLLTKHKEENFANVARGLALLQDGGTLVCAGANDDGAASLEKHVAKALGIAETISKFHCRVFWLTKGEKMPPAYWRGFAGLQPVSDGSWRSTPGIFAWDKIDEGSALLARHLPENLAGHVADFGCGWGFLSREALLRSSGIRRIDLIDAEHLALDAAQTNITDERAAFHWLDLTTEAPPHTYDAIISNPPFHTGRASTPELGQQVIDAASRALRPGGRFYMVANRGLPYERMLKANFASFETLSDNNKFRITRAVR